MTDSFLSDLSSPEQSIPGGAAAAAHVGVVGLGLLEKIIRIEMRRYPGPSEDSPWENLLDQVSTACNTLYRLRDEDGRIYMRLVRVKKSDAGPEKVASVLEQAIDCPMKIMEQTRKALGCVAQTAKYCKKHLLSDLNVVCELLGGAGRGAGHIARANLHLMTDPIKKAEYRNRLDRHFTMGCEAIESAEGSIQKKRL
ncbi:MAG: cyclodeaminase/cyclohydrolase family protein [Deltaproteobacteria bacterium]|nr:cyclodeaminase/cyclohydrolase family protein [Deltaproteobacteria bacterium]